MMNVATNNVSFQGARADKLRQILQGGIDEGFGTYIETVKLGKRQKVKWIASHMDPYMPDKMARKEVRDLYFDCKRTGNFENGHLGIGETEKLAKRNLLKNTMKMFDRTGWPEVKRDYGYLA